MAKNQESWNIQIGDIPYTIEYRKNKISVNKGEMTKLGKLQKENTMLETKYILPIPGEEVALHVKQNGKRILTVGGRVWDTGEVYTPAQMPGWGWVFVVLHALNFFLFISGAVGGAFAAAFALMSANISAKTNMKLGLRIFCCIAFWMVVTIVEYFLACMMFGA